MTTNTKNTSLKFATFNKNNVQLYPSSGLPNDANGGRITVDVVSQSNNAEAEPILLEVFTNVDQNKGMSYYYIIIIKLLIIVIRYIDILR